MSFHRRPFADYARADWRPNPIALVVYVAGVGVLGWSAYDFGQRTTEESTAAQAEPWRPATSRWSRKEARGGQDLRGPTVAGSVVLPALPDADDAATRLPQRDAPDMWRTAAERRDR